MIIFTKMKDEIKQRFLEGDYGEVITLLESVSEFHTDEGFLFYYLVSANELFVRTKDDNFLNKAKNIINAAQPLQEASLLRLASLTYLHSGDYKEAIEYAKKALVNDSSTSTFIALGNAYRAGGEFNKAMELYEQARSADSVTAEINLFELYQQLNKKDKAQKMAQVILEKVSHLEGVSVYKDYIEVVRRYLTAE